jgi:hypothetical protein
MQIEKVRTYCNRNEKERLTEITQHQPIAVSTQINLAYINHSLDLSTYELLLLSAMTFILNAHLRDQIFLRVYSLNSTIAFWDWMRVVLGCLSIF